MSMKQCESSQSTYLSEHESVRALRKNVDRAMRILALQDYVT